MQTDIAEYSEDYVAINEEGVVPSPTACEYEGFVEVDHSNYGIKSTATNTMQFLQKKETSHVYIW